MKPKTRNRKTAKKTIPSTPDRLAQQTFNAYVEAAIQGWASELPSNFPREDYATLLERYVDLAFKKVAIRFHYKEKAINVSVSAAAIAEKIEQYDDTELWAQDDFNQLVLPLLEQSDLQNIGIRMDDLRMRANELNLSTHETERVIRSNIARLYPDMRPKKVQHGEELIRIVEELNHIKEHIRTSKQINSFEDLQKTFSHFRIVKIMQTSDFDDDDRRYFANAGKWQTRPESYVRAILNKHWGEKSPQTYKDYRKAVKRWTREHQP
jgi:hypothetical protein